MFEESDETIKKNKKTCGIVFVSCWGSQKWLSPFFIYSYKERINFYNYFMVIYK